MSGRPLSARRVATLGAEGALARASGGRVRACPHAGKEAAAWRTGWRAANAAFAPAHAPRIAHRIFWGMIYTAAEGAIGRLLGAPKSSNPYEPEMAESVGWDVGFNHAGKLLDDGFAATIDVWLAGAAADDLGNVRVPSGAYRGLSLSELWDDGRRWNRHWFEWALQRDREWNVPNSPYEAFGTALREFLSRATQNALKPQGPE